MTSSWYACIAASFLFVCGLAFERERNSHCEQCASSHATQYGELASHDLQNTERVGSAPWPRRLTFRASVTLVRGVGGAVHSEEREKSIR